MRLTANLLTNYSMPRTYIYHGQPGHVGRFGYLEVGSQVDLRLDEELSVAGHPDYEALSEQKLPERIVPLKARFIYDLRRIDWAHKQIASELRTLSHHTLLNILVAMNELGIEVDAFDSMPTDDVVDNIRRAARAHGWDTLTPAERLECPAASDEDTSGETGEEDTEPNGQDGKEPQGEKSVEEEDKEPSASDEEDAEEEEEGDEDDKEQPSEEAPAAPAGPARKRAAAKNAAKPRKP